jgi:hypothetical protein
MGALPGVAGVTDGTVVNPAGSFTGPKAKEFSFSGEQLAHAR